MTMVDLARELYRPREDAGWIVKVGIGALFSLALQRWYLLPLTFFAAGYLYRHFSDTFQGKETDGLPEWEDWKGLFLTGFIVFLITAGYLIVPRFCYALSRSVLAGGILAKMVAMAFFAVTALLYVAAFFFIPMGIAQYVREEKISAAFYIREIWDRIMNVGDDYFKITLLSIVALILFAVLRAFPFIGPLLAAAAGFYISLVLAALFGEICRKAYGETKDPDVAPKNEKDPIE